MRALIREPLIQFLVLGAGIFVLFLYVGDRAEIEPDEILVSAGQIERLSQIFRKTRLRPPTQQELEGLIDEHIREEVFYREAKLLGLDRDNAVIRRHLRQRMEFLSEDIALQTDPTEGELAQFLADHPQSFRVDPQVSFRHIYFSRDDRGELARADAERALAALEGSASVSAWRDLGDTLPLPSELSLESQPYIANMFGSSFANAVAQLEPGRWQGPVESGFGLHLVYVIDRVAARAPALDEIRDAVVREWRESRRLETNEAFYQGLRTRYSVVVEKPEWLEADLNLQNVEQR